jgi:hypothetical protein
LFHENQVHLVTGEGLNQAGLNYFHNHFHESAMKQKSLIKRPFWLEYLRVMGIDAAIVLFISIILGFHQISNLFFFSSAVLFIIAVIPIFSDVGASAKAIRKARKDSVPFEGKTDAQVKKAEFGWRTTILFSLAGITTFVLSILTIKVGS